MDEAYDAVVVGGGIVGASTAYHLARAGSETLLVDRADEGRATDAAAGVLAPATSSRTGDDDWFELATEAVAYADNLVKELERQESGDTGYERRGALTVAIDDDELEAYDEAMSRIEYRQDDLADVVEIEPTSAVDRFPALAEPKRAFFDPSAAQVDGRSLANALIEAGTNHGFATTDGDVTALDVADDCVSGVETADGRRINAEIVIVAGGAWSPDLADQLGVNVPIEPMRGQIVHLAAPDADTSNWPIVRGFQNHYAVPWSSGNIAVGATRERGAGFEPRVTVAGLREVFMELLRLTPGLADATLLECRVGFRPVSADGLPIVGSVPDVEGVFLATGHGATGLMLGPYTGALVAESVHGDPDAVPDQLSPARFHST